MALDTATVRIAAKVAGEDAVRSLAKSLEITEKEAKQLIQTNLKLGGSAKSAAAGMTAAGGASSTAAKGFALARGAAAALAATLAPLAALVGVGSIARLGMDAETAGAKLRTMQGAIPDFEKLGPLLQQVAKETGGLVGPAELSAGAYEILSAGATSAADAAAKLKAALVLAQGGSVDTAVAVDGLTSVMNAYGVETSRAGEVADKIRQTVDDGKISFEQYATQIGKVTAIAASAGVSFDQVNAAIAAITASGIQSESAVSGLRQLIVNIIKPTDDAQKVAKQYGIELSAAALKSKGLVGVLEDIRTKTGGNSQAVSKLITDVDSLTAAQALFAGQGEKFKELIDKQTTSAGAASKAADILAQTTEASTKRIQASFEGLSVTLVQTLAPVFNWLAERLASLFGAVDSAIGAIGNLVRSAQQLPVVGGLLNGSNFATGAQAALSLTPGANVFANIFGVFSPNRSAPPAARRPAQTPRQKYQGLLPNNGPSPSGTQPTPTTDGGSGSGGNKKKERTQASIEESLDALDFKTRTAVLQQAKESADEYNRALIDYQLERGRINQQYLDFVRGQGVTEKEKVKAAELRDQELKTALKKLEQSKKEIQGELLGISKENLKANSDLNEALALGALIPKGDDVKARVEARYQELKVAVADYIKRLEDLVKDARAKGGPAAEELIRLLNNDLAQARDPNGTLSDRLLRGSAQAQIQTADSATVAADQRRELQQLQDQLQALLQPFGELTAVQQLELRLKRENIALSPEERAQRFADAAAIDKTREAIRQLNEQQQLSRQLAEGIADSFREAFKGLLFQAQSLEEALSNLFGRLADQLFNLAFNIGVFGNPFGFAGSVFGQVLPGFEKRAAGGPVSAGSPYIVGERGPEVFVPRTSGTIVPNGAGGVSVVVNVDAKGTAVQGNDPQGQQLGRVVSAAVQAELLRQKRPGGILAGGRA